MKKIIYIGVDDTDILGSPGTGRVARELVHYLEGKGLAESLGVTRHQLLVDSRIRYTSHNSSKGIAVRTDKPVNELYQPCIDYLKGCLQPGADPGLCICPLENATEDVIRYGFRAVTSVLSKEEAKTLAEKNGIFLREIGGDGGGIIGALAAVGLRASGNDGRLVDLPGIRDITGLVSVSDITRRTGIAAVQDTLGNPLEGDEKVESLDWIRPVLSNGKPVLKVEMAESAAGGRVWHPAGRKHKAKAKDKGGQSAE